MNTYSLFGLSAGLLGLAVTTLLAQSETGVEKNVKVEIRALSVGRGITDLGVVQKGKKTPFYPPSFSLSTPFIYEGPPELVFTQTQVSEGISREVPVASVSLPLKESKVLLVLTPSALKPGEYNGLVIPSELAGPAASARVINLSNRAISMELNGKAQRAKPGEALGVKLSKGKVTLFIPRVHKIADDEADICRETYTAPEGGRLTLLLMNESGAQSAESESLVVIPLAENSQLATPPNTALKESMP